MAINVRNFSGKTLGSICNGKIFAFSGKEVGYISGNKIHAFSGKEVGYISGSKIHAFSGKELGRIHRGPLGVRNGNMVLNFSGGEELDIDDGASDAEIGAAAILLYYQGEEQTNPEPLPVSMPNNVNNRNDASRPNNVNNRSSSGGGGGIVILIILALGFLLGKTVVDYVSAFLVCAILIVAIIVVCIIVAKIVKSDLGKCFTVLIGIGLIIGVLVVRPDIIDGNITSEFIGVRYENALYKAGVRYFDKGKDTKAIAKLSKAIDHYEIRTNEYSDYVYKSFDVYTLNTAIMGAKTRKLRSDLYIKSYYTRGAAYYRTEDYAAAIADYEKVESLMTEYRSNGRGWGDEYLPRIYVSLGDAYGAHEEYDMAVWNYNTYLETESPDEPVNFTVDKSNPADMWFCAALWNKKVLTNEQKYEKWIQEICDKNAVTRAEIEAFYRENRRSIASYTAARPKPKQETAPATRPIHEMTLFTGLTEEAKASADLSPYDGKAVTEVHDLAEASRWIKRNAKNNGIYTIVLGTEQSAEKLSFGYGYKRVTVTLASAGGKKTLTRSDGLQYPIITIKGKGTTFTLEDGITLSGTGEANDDAASLVKIDRGTFEMNGGIITGGENSGVYIGKKGAFVMNGGTITGNHSYFGGGVDSKGAFTMTGGTISGNTAQFQGGGVYYSNSTFTMTGGVISGNTTGSEGGGVYGFIRKSGGFFKSGGIIYGENATEALANKMQGQYSKGEAIYILRGDNLAHYNGFDKTVTEKTKLSSKDGYSNWEWDYGN